MSNIKRADISYRHRYNIRVGAELGDELINFCRESYSSQKLIVIIDAKVNGLHGNRVKKKCREYFEEVDTFEIPEGEQSKSVSQWNILVDKVLQSGVERGTPVLAVGGGVTGDLAGFVAASVLRGLPLIHIPTSLLAMVDSSIGGKTGVNHVTGKNLIGAFYQPDAVFADILFLETLEHKEWITGMAEILKYAAIRDSDLFAKLEALCKEELKPGKQWAEIIARSAAIKVNIVEEDTLEAGKRAYLNFGHTFGHALENAAGYGSITHGEAVFAGMIAATYFSHKLGHPVSQIRFEPFVPLYKQQISALPDDVHQLIDIMKTDKKVKENTLRLVLLNGWSSPYIYKCTDFELLEEAWNHTLAIFNDNFEHT